MFWRHMLSPSSSYTLKIKEVGSSEMLATNYKTLQYHNPEDHNLNKSRSFTDTAYSYVTAAPN
jgi:hypothetical protein